MCPGLKAGGGFGEWGTVVGEDRLDRLLVQCTPPAGNPHQSCGSTWFPWRRPQQTWLDTSRGLTGSVCPSRVLIASDRQTRPVKNHQRLPLQPYIVPPSVGELDDQVCTAHASVLTFISRRRWELQRRSRRERQTPESYTVMHRDRSFCGLQLHAPYGSPSNCIPQRTRLSMPEPTVPSFSQPC